MPVESQIAALLATVVTLKDRQDIRDCIVRECRARDRQDVAQIEGCWWADGVDEHGPVITNAPDYAERANLGHRGGFQMTSHKITNHLCDIDGDTAHCETYVLGSLFWRDGDKTTIAFGRYLDRLEKRNGEWRLLVRKCTIEMTADADPAWVRSDAVRGFLKARWGDADPSYDRPYESSRDGLRW